MREYCSALTISTSVPILISKGASGRAMTNVSIVVAVIGSGKDKTKSGGAERLGQLIAENGFVLITGGGGGIMEEASRGAASHRGLVLGILPSDSRDDPRYAGRFPNRFVGIPIFTGMSQARNSIIAKTAECVFAFRGGEGTISEICMTLNCGGRVVLVDWDDFSIPELNQNGALHKASCPEEAIRLFKSLIKA